MAGSNLRHLPLASAPELIAPAGAIPSPAEAVGGEDERLLQVGDLAKATGKTVRAIHHYEDVGLLKPHARSKGRYRLYDPSALVRIRWIGKLHDLGLSLAQIQAIVDAWETSTSTPRAMSEIRAVYQQKLSDTREQIAHLVALERELEASVAYLDACGTCDPEELVKACACCHVQDRQQPDLVAGIHGRAGRAPRTAGPRESDTPEPARPTPVHRTTTDGEAAFTD